VEHAAALDRETALSAERSVEVCEKRFAVAETALRAEHDQTVASLKAEHVLRLQTAAAERDQAEASLKAEHEAWLQTAATVQTAATMRNQADAAAMGAIREEHAMEVAALSNVVAEAAAAELQARKASAASEAVLRSEHATALAAEHEAASARLKAQTAEHSNELVEAATEAGERLQAAVGVQAAEHSKELSALAVALRRQFDQVHARSNADAAHADAAHAAMLQAQARFFARSVTEKDDAIAKKEDALARIKEAVAKKEGAVEVAQQAMEGAEKEFFHALVFSISKAAPGGSEFEGVAQRAYRCVGGQGERCGGVPAQPSRARAESARGPQTDRSTSLR
jgi:hypothetical protein